MVAILEMSGADTDSVAEAFERDAAPRLILILVQRFGISLQTAEDLVHDALVKVLDAPEIHSRLTNRSPDFDRYVSRAAMNRAVDAFRRLRVQRAALLYSDATEGVAPEALSRLLSEETSTVVRGAVAKLREPYRSIFKLQLDSELSLAEIADALTLSRKGIYTQYNRGLARLRQILIGSKT